MRTLQYLSMVSCFSLLCACGGGGGGYGGNGPTSSTNGGPVPNTLSGTITLNGAPMAGVTVTAVNTNTGPSTILGIMTTDANGNYSFNNISTGCNCTLNDQFWPNKAGYSFYPVIAANPTGSTAAYQWNPAPQNWSVNVGAAVTRAGFNGQFAGLNTNNSPVIFTVINFNSLPNNSVTGANFRAYDGSNAPASVAASGQQTSFAAGDDAALKKGRAWPSQRFIDNNNGTVSDALTGLVWLKNAGCLAPALWVNAVAAANGLANGACGLTDGSSAGQWRLPNLVELESLMDVSANSPAITPGNPFSNVSNGNYWSSTVYYGGLAGSTNAWAIRFSDGRYMNDTSSDVMATAYNNVWAVRGSSPSLQASGAYVHFANGDDGSTQAGAPLPFPRMRDNGNGTVTDMATGLVWMKKADCIHQSWTGAVAAVNALASGQCGLADGSTTGSWRMPNRKEMQSLADRALNNHADYFDSTFTSITPGIASIAPVFNNFIQFQYYWTSSTDAADITKAWAVFSCDYGVYDYLKTNMGYSLAVR